MKAGAFAVAPGPEGARPDLTGLSCRFDEIPAGHGVILSLIVTPARDADPAAFAGLIADILSLVESTPQAGRPVPTGGPALHWPPPGLIIEAEALGGSGLWNRIRLLVHTFLAHLIFRAGLPIGGFDPVRYRKQLVENTDFRKFDDGLRMTLDCSPGLADRLEQILAKAEQDGIARSGTHRQNAALMTCFVPSATRSDHIHFVDGAMGGYAAAARILKAGL